MEKLKLLDVTLVMVETQEHELAALAIEDCQRVAEFGDVLVLTDQPKQFFNGFFKGNRGDFQIHEVSNWPSKVGWSRSWWYDVPPLLKTSHTLNIQWDSWIWKPELWDDKFLNYDYIGAPWWYKDGKNVGNGGFSLISTALKRYLRANRQKFPCNTPVDDDLLCREYRPALEDLGFVWAPEAVAHRFAFECCRPSPKSEHFGFHGAFNFSEVLSEERFLARARLMACSDYITNPNGVIWKAFSQKHPDLAAQLLWEKKNILKGASSV